MATSTTNQGIQLEQLVGLQINQDGGIQMKRKSRIDLPLINIVYKDYLKEQQNPAITYLTNQSTIDNLEISSLSFINSETSTMKINYLNVDECDEEIYSDLVRKPYIMMMIITDSNVKDYKKNSYPQMEKFVESCKSMGIDHFLFLYCPILDASMKKSRGFESKIVEILNEIISDGENKLNLQRNRFLKLIDIDPQSSTNDQKEFQEFCKREFQMLLRLLVKESIEKRIEEIENDIFTYNEKKNLPEWSYQISLLKKERLISLLNSLGLNQEALQQYEECNNTVYELIMRGKLNIKEEMEGVEKGKDNLIPLINSPIYDNYEDFSKQVLKKGLHFFKFYQILIRKIILQMTKMQFFQELMDRLQYFLKFMHSSVFAQMDCTSDNIKLFHNIWTILTINHIIEFFVEQKRTQHYGQLQLNDIDYNIIILREIQLKSMQKIAQILFSISLQEMSVQSVEQEFEKLEISISTNKLRRIKSFIKERDISQFSVLTELNGESTFSKTFSDSTLFFNSYTTIISDQIISLNKLQMYKKQYIYQINLLKFKILAKEIKIPHKALALECEEVYQVLEGWPNLLTTGLIYKLLFYKNHCVVEQFRRCCIKLIKLKVLTLQQRNLILRILKEDNENIDQNSDDHDDDKELDEDLLGQTVKQRSSTILQKYYKDEISESPHGGIDKQSLSSTLKKDKKKKQKYIKVEDSELCLIEKFYLEKTHGQTYEGKLKIKKLYDFSIQDAKIQIKLESASINRSNRYSQEEYEWLQKQNLNQKDNSENSPQIQPTQYEILEFELDHCEFNESTNTSITKEIEILQKGCYTLKSVSLIIGQYKFKSALSNNASSYLHKINLPSLNICSLLEYNRVEIPYYHEIPILISIIDHNFSKQTNLKLIYNHEALKLENKYICFTQGNDKNSYIENKQEITHKDIIQLTQKQDNINKMAIIVYFKAIRKNNSNNNNNKIDHGTFSGISIKLIEESNVLDQFDKQVITSTFYQQDIKKLDIFYNINVTNLSDYNIIFSYQSNQTQSNSEVITSKNESISKTINPQNEKVFIRFQLDERNLSEVGQQNFIDELSFLKELKISDYFIQKEISKDTILKDSTLIKNPKLDIYVNNMNAHCYSNEIVTIEIQVKILANRKLSNPENKTFYTLLAQNKREGSYLLLGQTQISTQNKSNEQSWKLQILPIKCGVFCLPEFEVIEYYLDDHHQLNQDKLTNNQYILRYYAEPIISVTSDSSKIKNSSAFFN